MALPTSPSAAFPSMVASPLGVATAQMDDNVVMTGSMNWEPVRQRLLGDDLNEALTAALELREGIEIVHTVEFPLMLSALLPAFSTILGHRTTASPDKSTVEHKLRNAVLEIISRMPSNEILRPHAPHLVAVALDVLNRDYEENALLASRIIFDLYKVYRSLPQDYVQPYLDFVQNAYRALPTSVQRNFLYSALAVGSTKETSSRSETSPLEKSKADASETPTKAGTPVAAANPKTPPPATASATTKSSPENPTITSTASVGDPSIAAKTPTLTPPKVPTSSTPPLGMTPSPSMSKIPHSPVARLSPKSSSSFRVLTECPLVVMLMFQLYPKFLRGNIPSLINVMMEALALRAPTIQSVAQGTQTLDGSAKRLYFSRCRELVAAQAKTLSFLTYLLRGFSNDLKPYEDRLASNVVALMSTCPREFISTRKELLVATRHLLNSEFRNGFYRHVDALLDERVLMGAHHRYFEQTILRPLGYTTLSDLVHHVRPKLNLNQISRVVSIFSRVLHDSSMTLSMSTQYTAVRTLLSLVDLVYHNKDRNPQIGRDILVRILKALVDKLTGLQNRRKGTDSKTSKSAASMIEELELPVGNDRKETVRDLKSMIRAIIVGHKTLIWYISSYRAQREKEKIETMPPMPGSNEEVASAMLKITHTEHALIDRYIDLAFTSMRLLQESDSEMKQEMDAEKPAADHYRDALTFFAAAFTTLDGYDLRRTLGRRLDKLVEAVTEDPTVILVPRHLLTANNATSFEFCSLLLNYLVDRMEELATFSHKDIIFIPPPENCDTNEVERLKSFCENRVEVSADERLKKSSAYLQLFERVLKSLTVYPDNEKALRPYLRRMVSTCLQASMEKATFKMDNYCMLLRYIFRSISAGKFEESYRELLPLIPTVLNGLFRVFQATDDMFLQHTIIELLLTIPARLSSLLPHMNLLLRVIISALESNSGDLVNLGLRTLEFWVDNLNPEFLFPELSKQKLLFVRLMKALSTHLRPAPYPYGLLTLRLLGKLGGKNRRVLRELIDIKEPSSIEATRKQLKVQYCWLDYSSPKDGSATERLEPNKEKTVSLPVPIDRCVEILQRLLFMPAIQSQDETAPDSGLELLSQTGTNQLTTADLQQMDFLPHCYSVMDDVKCHHAESALAVLRTALTTIIGKELPDFSSVDTSGAGFKEVATDSEKQPLLDMQSTALSRQSFDKDLEQIGLGFMLGCAVDSVSEHSIQFTKGLLTYLFLVVASHQRCFLRVDANGSVLENKADAKGVARSTKDFFAEELGSLNPFGYFQLSGCLQNSTNPLSINKSLANMLCQPTEKTWKVGLNLLEHVLSLPDLTGSSSSEDESGLNRGTLIFHESLLSALCEKCIASPWNRREGLFEGICLLVEKLGREWSTNYETEIMQVVLFSLKDIPREMSMAAGKAFRFVVTVCGFMYGAVKTSGDDLLVDLLNFKASSQEVKESTEQDDSKQPESPVLTKESKEATVVKESTEQDDSKQPESPVLTKESKEATVVKESTEQDDSKKPESPVLTKESKEATVDDPCCPCDSVVEVLLNEVASTRHILRLASRYILRHYVIENQTEEQRYSTFKKHLTLIKRVLFSRSLRLLPLPEQVSVVEALALIVDRLPDLIPLNDQHLLAFLSELLKMSSVADGEMTDSNLVGSVVDKNGRAIPAHEGSTAANKDAKAKHYEIPSSSLFLRRDCIINVGKTKIHISQELPTGVQLRVSSIHLLRSVIRGHSNIFFDAESSTPIGNIRPHVISLLFRSLVSFPTRAVAAAHDALRDVLTLSVVSEGGKSKSRLRKELLQTCIRPVLLNLRDYSRLSVHLLRGLSRLLSLLSSWFNKTLGEKLLDHLQKWTDPNRLKAQKIWKEGEEPAVAAAIIDLFVLLPHASHFVEPLVKTTIKLEACLPVFKPRNAKSPFRAPLAKYLNKHCQYTVSFFLQRLKTPLYSEMFQDLIKFPESTALREYLSGRQCSVSILNVCFERPLAIIRSEKKASSAGVSPAKPFNPKDLFTLHGIHPFRASPTQRELVLKQDLETKKKKLQILQQELARQKEAFQTKNSSGTAPPHEIEDAKRKHRIAKTAYDRGAKEFNESKQKYLAEVAQAKALPERTPPQEPGSPRPMIIEALELQHQGFRLVWTLMSRDGNYLKEHNDVLRAFRWLWRSKGRYLRLQHEDSVPPRYHVESRLLATILVDYSRNFSQDVDLLFELIRIFLQSSCDDFTFVRTYLSIAVSSLSVDQRKQVVQRFFALLAGESTEEIKTLSLQLVVYPMLSTSFEENSGAIISGIDNGEKTVDKNFEFIDKSMPKKFVQEVLYKNGKVNHWGDRLKVELLKMTSILLQYVSSLMVDLSDNIVKFCWPLLKSEDPSCKNWAYLVLCRHIASIPTAPKIILQVYGALIRSHQQEGKEVVRQALNLLVPAMQEKLDEKHLEKAIEQTNRIMFEEVNSIPQLAHIWQTVVTNPEIFYNNRHQFVRYMINSLTRLGLPPNAPTENRTLSIQVIELVLTWHRRQSSHFVERKELQDAKRKASDISYGSEKKRKTEEGAVSIQPESEETHLPLLDRNMVDTMINFLLRMKILIADPKLDIHLSDIEKKINPLFHQILAGWKDCRIRTVYLEKVVSLCRELNISDRFFSNKNKPEAKASPKTRSKSRGNSTNSSGKGDESRQITAPLVAACLDLFCIVSDVAPTNPFLTRNSAYLSEILASAFHFSRGRDEATLRNKLRHFVVKILTGDMNGYNLGDIVIQKAKVLLERFLLEAEKGYRNATAATNSSEASRHAIGRLRGSSHEEKPEDIVALFALQILKDSVATKPSAFKSFSQALLKLLTTIVKGHASFAAARQKQEGVSFIQQSGTSTIRQMYHTPVAGILEEMYSSEQMSGSLGPRAVQSKEPFPSRELNEYNNFLQAAVLILGIIGSSDIPLTFTRERKVLFQAINTILDTSNCLQLLVVAVHTVGRWLLIESGCPLTLKERNCLLLKMASTGFNGLPDTLSQPLTSLVSRYLIACFKDQSRQAGSSRTIDEDVTDTDLEPHVSSTTDVVLGKSLVGCLLTANHGLREELLSLFVSQAGLLSGKESSVEEIPVRTADEIFWQLLHSDFECLGGRNWSVLFLDLLLRTVSPSTGSESQLKRSIPTPSQVLEGQSTAVPPPSSCANYEVFCSILAKSTDDDGPKEDALCTSLRQLVYGDARLLQELLETLLPAAWASIESDTFRANMIAPMESLLSRGFHSQFLKQVPGRSDERSSNVIRSFLNAIRLFSPLPLLNVDLLVSLAETYNCWYEVLSILEHQHSVLSMEKKSKLCTKLLLAICHCYRQLDEKPVLEAIALKSCNLPQTRRATSLMLYGKADEALDLYSELVELVAAGDGPVISEMEGKFIEEQWVTLQREHCQIDVVSEYATVSQNSMLMLESAWKHRDWDRVRSLCTSAPLVAAVESGKPIVKMCETLLAVADGKLGEVENLHAQTAQLCLYKWQLLPEVSSGSSSHGSLLHFFHRLVEIRESGQIMVETSNHSNGKTLPDLKNLLNAWRHRLPNDYEELTLWDEVFTWRAHMFNAITSNFSWSEPTTLATLHDKPWTAIRMATVARKQGMRQTSLLLLNKLTDNRAMDVSDAYLKLREQILFYNNPDSEMERTGGLNLINTTNLLFFDASQKSELFRLKAMFLSSLRRTSKSNQAYCHSVQICPTYAKAWISWGGLCSSLGTLTEKQAEQQATKGGSSESSKESRAASTKKVAQYLAQAMGCYLEAVQIDRSDKTRIHLPKCLWILTKDGSVPGVLSQTIENRGTKLPPWVWLPWIPQLLTGLCRVEGRAIKAILSRVVKAYPQAVYYSLRAFYLERRDVERAKGISSSSSQHMPSVSYAEEMMSTLRRSHASLWSSLEAILEELIVKFRPSYEEELLATISALLERAESHAERQSLPDKAREEDEDAMVASWSKTLSRIAAKFFRDTEASAGSSRRDERVKKTADFKRKYKFDFESDFKVSAADGQEGASPSASKPQFRLDEYIIRLQKWKRRLEEQVACTPTALPLIESSHSLAMFVGETPDLWPGACDTKYLIGAKDRHEADESETTRIQSTTSSSAAIARKAALSAALAAASAAAREGVGGEYGGGSAAIEIPGQYCPNSSSTADVMPCPELHAKLQRFEPCVEVLRRNDQLVRRVGMVGSDGRVYRFLLQFAIPYWTRTDERTAQTAFVLDKFLQRNTVCARNHLAIRPCATIPVAQRLRMTLDVQSRISLDEVFRSSLAVSERKLETLPELFSKMVSEKMIDFTENDTSKDEKEKAEKKIRGEVYRDICSSKVKKTVLLEFLHRSLESPERLFTFRRAFAGHLATNSLLQYVFSVAERTPQRFVIVQSNAQVLSPDFRVSYSNQGFIESTSIPFRLTPNIESLIGPSYLDGRFIRSMAMVAGAVREHRDEIDPILRLLMRDDILAWYSKSLAKTDSKTQELERQLIERVSKNVGLLHSRFSQCAPSSSKSNTDNPIDWKVQELCKEASSIDRLSMMPTNYHAWL